MHYDIISAFIKSIRGSDPDGAIYWLARMVAGEDPEFIARRLVISASEDIGLANPNALLLANACFDALKKIGWPEGGSFWPRRPFIWLAARKVIRPIWRSTTLWHLLTGLGIYPYRFIYIARLPN